MLSAYGYQMVAIQIPSEVKVQSMTRTLTKGIRVISAVAGLCVALSLPAESQGNRSPGLFGSREIHSTNMASFDKWTGLWRRHNLQKQEEIEAPNGQVSDHVPECRGRDRIRCGREAWESFIEDELSIIQSSTAEASDGNNQNFVPINLEMINRVNLYMNKTSYIVDPVNWGLPDYWATPDEFFLKDGDCEDYAISKYITLKRLGVDPSKMRLVILQDENLRIAHAVLAVLHNGTYHIMDNQVDGVLPHDQILHYRPVYSINETGWWLHQVRRFTRR